jgi:hypothetical protein
LRLAVARAVSGCSGAQQPARRGRQRQRRTNASCRWGAATGSRRWTMGAQFQRHEGVGGAAAWATRQHGDMDDRQRVRAQPRQPSAVSRQSGLSAFGPHVTPSPSYSRPLVLCLPLPRLWSLVSGVPALCHCHGATLPSCTHHSRQRQMPQPRNAPSKLPTALTRPATLTVAPLPSWGGACASSPLSAVSAAIPGA